MSTHEQTIDVEAPVRVVYDQWTQFEEFPRFMDGVSEISQISDDRVHWRVDFGGVEREFDTRITEQEPDQRIAWTTTSGEEDHAGVVTFHRLDDHHTRVTLQMEYAPDGLIEHIGDKAGFVSHRLKGDMKNFKSFIEDRQASTGAWRGRIT